MKIKCYKCLKKMKKKGALIFSPPVYEQNNIDITKKIHICQDCFQDLKENWLYK